MSRRPVSRRWLAILAVLLLLAASLPLPVSGGETTEVMAPKLPTPRDGTAAVGIGVHVYIFGGDSGTRSDQILRYDALNDTLEVLATPLPRPMSGLSAVHADGVVYLFGGWGSPYSDQVYRFDPVNETLDIMDATMPSGRTYTSAVWTGAYAYVFGGTIACSPCTTDQILRYDPETDSFATMSAQLPTRRAGTSAVWDGQYAYIIGGHTVSDDERFDQIVRYDPLSDSATILPAKLPTGRTHTSAVFADGKAHIFGGTPCGGTGTLCDSILEFDPASGLVAANATTLTTARYLTSAAVADRSAYIIGGYDGARSDQILRHGQVIPNNLPHLDAVPNQTLDATAPFNLTIRAHDADNDGISLSIAPLPGNATFSDHGNGTGTFAWTPDLSDIGAHTLEATASDRFGATNITIRLDVVHPPDRPPVIDPIADQTIHAEGTLTVPVTANDPDGDPITLNVTSLPAGAAFTDHGDGNGTFAWTPERAQIGTHTVEVNATAHNNTTLATFDIIVQQPPNRFPVFDPVADQTVVAEDTLTVQVRASDPDGDAVSLGIDPLPDNATFTDHGDGSGTFTWVTNETDIGSHTFILQADDGNDTTNETLVVQVIANPPPDIVPIPDQSADEATVFILDVQATDPAGAAITLSMSGLPAGANFTDYGDGIGTFAWDIPYSAAGSYSLTLSATNADATAEETFVLTVRNVDRPPVFTTLPTQHRIGHHLALSVHVAATDPDGVPVSLTAAGLPSGATFTDHGNSSATFTWNDADPLGTHSVLVTASAQGASVSASFAIEVVPLYDFRLVDPSPGLLVRASPGDLLEFTFGLSNTGYLNDTIQLHASDVSRAREGFDIVAPGPVHVEPGATVPIALQVQVPDHGSQARIRVIAASSNDPELPSRMLNWIIEVPVHIQVVLNDDRPNLVDGTALTGLEGHVRLTWQNGENATGLPFTVTHRYMDLERATFGATTDDNGTWAFSGADDLFLGLPGQHEFEIQVTRGVRTDEATHAWSVAAMRDLPQV